MAAASFSLTAVVQDVVQVAEFAQQPAQVNATPVNANQAQGAPAPADTVTLTNQAAEGQQTGQDPNRGHFDHAAFLGAAGAYFGANAARPNRQAPELPLQLFAHGQPQDAPAAAADNAAKAAPNAAANAANTAANTANTAASAAAPAANGNFTTPQQQLQQLDQSLQQLGINPQSIPLFNRMAMLLYANDPAALRLLVQTLQTAATQQGAGQASTATANAAANANQAAAQELLPAATPATPGQAAPHPPAVAPAQTQPAAQTQPPSQAQTGQTAEQIDVIAAQINFTEVQATLQPAHGAANQTAQASPLTVQIEQLQIAFQAIEVQQGPLQLNGSSGPAPSGNALSVNA